MGFIKRFSHAPATPPEPSNKSWKKLRQRPLSIISYSNDLSYLQGSNGASQDSRQSLNNPSIASSINLPSSHPSEAVPDMKSTASTPLGPAFEGVSSLKSLRLPSPKKKLRRKQNSITETSSDSKNSKDSHSSARSFFLRHSKNRSSISTSSNSSGSSEYTGSSKTKANQNKSSENLKKLSKSESLSFGSKQKASPVHSKQRCSTSLGFISSPVTSTFVHHRHVSNQYELSWSEPKINTGHHHHHLRPNSVSLGSFEKLFLGDSLNQNEGLGSAFPLPTSYSALPVSSRFPDCKTHDTSPSAINHKNNQNNSCTSTSHSFKRLSLGSHENVVFPDFTTNDSCLDSSNHSKTKFELKSNQLNLDTSFSPEPLHTTETFNHDKNEDENKYKGQDEDEDSYIVEGIDNSISQWISISHADVSNFSAFNTCSSVGTGSVPSSPQLSMSNNSNDAFNSYQFPTNPEMSQQSQQQQHLHPARSLSTSKWSHKSSTFSLDTPFLPNMNKRASMPPLNLFCGSETNQHDRHQKQQSGIDLALQNPSTVIKSTELILPFDNVPTYSSSTTTTANTTPSSCTYTVPDSPYTPHSPPSYATSSDDHEGCSGSSSSSPAPSYSKASANTPKQAPHPLPMGPDSCAKISNGTVQVINSHGIVWIGEPKQATQISGIGCNSPVTNVLANEIKQSTHKHVILSQPVPSTSKPPVCVDTPAPASPSSFGLSANSVSDAAGLGTFPRTKPNVINKNYKKNNKNSNSSSDHYSHFGSNKGLASIRGTNNGFLNVNGLLNTTSSDMVPQLSPLCSPDAYNKHYCSSSIDSSVSNYDREGNDDNKINNNHNNTFSNKTNCISMPLQKANFASVGAAYIWNDETAQIFMDNDEDESGDYERHDDDLDKIKIDIKNKSYAFHYLSNNHENCQNHQNYQDQTPNQHHQNRYFFSQHPQYAALDGTCQLPDLTTSVANLTTLVSKSSCSPATKNTTNTISTTTTTTTTTTTNTTAGAFLGSQTSFLTKQEKNKSNSNNDINIITSSYSYAPVIVLQPELEFDKSRFLISNTNRKIYEKSDIGVGGGSSSCSSNSGCGTGTRLSPELLIL